MARNQTFIDGVTPIPADWLNFVNAVANNGGSVGIASNAASAPPTTGTYETGDFIRNSNLTVLGQSADQYVVDGWKCIAGGTPGTWVEIRLTVAPTPGSSTASPSPAPATGGGGTFYTSTIQGEDMTGATPIGAAGLTAAGVPSGFQGTGMADQDSTSGVTKTATFTGLPTGTYDIVFRFFGFGNQQNSYQIDSATPVSVMWNGGGNYQNLTISGVSFDAGTHTVKFISEWGFTYIDAVTVTQTSGTVPVAAYTPPPAPSSSPGVNYPFGARTDGAYPYGITVTGYTNSQMDTAIKACYDSWKSLRLKTSPSFVGADGTPFAGQTITDAVYVDSPQTIVEPNQSTGDPGLYSATVSEAMGYGMLLTVLFAGYDTEAQSNFDKMLKLVRARPAYSQSSTAGANLYLMDWRLGTRVGKTGTPTDMSFQGGGYNACDGDLDITRALLMAHRQWGSTGTWNYWNEAQANISALKSANFAANGVMYVPPIGSQHDVSRTSDYMLEHFQVFKAATNDTFWDNAITNSVSLVSSVIASASPSAHLPPGWIYQPFTNPVPSPGGKIESFYEGLYDSNAVRDPWRWATYYVYTGNAGVKTLVTNIVTTIKTSASNSPDQTTWMYYLDGTSYTGTNLYYEPTTVAMTMAGALVDVAHQTWLNDCFTKLTQHFNNGYFSAELSLLSLVLVSGNWWKPL